jgi:acyl-CoA synthetase (AMP-forming)/AMP-acid ligase II
MCWIYILTTNNHVERHLTQSSSIDEAIIIGIPNERFGQIGVLLYSGALNGVQHVLDIYFDHQ